MSFLRRLRRDKEDTPPAEGTKEEPKDEPKDDEVRVYGTRERPLATRRSKSSPPPHATTETPPARAEKDTTPSVSPLPPAPPLPPLPATETPTLASPPPSPTVGVASSGPPPPLPERGPAHPPRTASTTVSDSACFVCGTPLEEKYCPLCQVTWAE